MPRGIHPSKRGPKPKPREVRALDGNAGRRPVTPISGSKGQQLTLGMFDLDVPPMVAESADATAEWNHIAPVLAHAGILTRADRRVMTMYCLASAHVDQVVQVMRDLESTDLATRGLLVPRGQFGDLALAPLVHGFHRAVKTYLQLAAEVGCTPAARNRVDVIEGEPAANPFARNGAPRRA